MPFSGDEDEEGAEIARPVHVPSQVWEILPPEHRVAIVSAIRAQRNGILLAVLDLTPGDEWKARIEGYIGASFIGLLYHQREEIRTWAGRTPFPHNWHEEIVAFFALWKVSPQFVYLTAMCGRYGRPLTADEHAALSRNQLYADPLFGNNGQPPVPPPRPLTDWDARVRLAMAGAFDVRTPVHDLTPADQAIYMPWVGMVGRVALTLADGRNVVLGASRDDTIHYHAVMVQAHHAQQPYVAVDDDNFDYTLVLLGNMLDALFDADHGNARPGMVTGVATRVHVCRQLDRFYTAPNDLAYLDESPLGNLLRDLLPDQYTRLALVRQWVPSIQALARAYLAYGLNPPTPDPNPAEWWHDDLYVAANATTLFAQLAVLPVVPSQPTGAAFLDLFPMSRLASVLATTEHFAAWTQLVSVASLSEEAKEALVAILKEQTWWWSVSNLESTIARLLSAGVAAAGIVALLESMPHHIWMGLEPQVRGTVIGAIVQGDTYQLAAACWQWRSKDTNEVLLDPLENGGAVVRLMFYQTNEVYLRILESISSANIYPVARLRVIDGRTWGRGNFKAVVWPRNADDPTKALPWTMVMRRILLYVTRIGIEGGGQHLPAILEALVERLSTSPFAGMPPQFFATRLVDPLVNKGYGPALQGIQWRTFMNGNANWTRPALRELRAAVTAAGH